MFSLYSAKWHQQWKIKYSYLFCCPGRASTGRWFLGSPGIFGPSKILQTSMSHSGVHFLTYLQVQGHNQLWAHLDGRFTWCHPETSLFPLSPLAFCVGFFFQLGPYVMAEKGPQQLWPSPLQQPAFPFKENVSFLIVSYDLMVEGYLLQLERD